MRSFSNSTPNDLIPELGAVKEKFNSLFCILIVGLIGSRAQGDNTQFSDLDVAVKRQRRIGLLAVVQATDWLEQHLGMDVDLVFFKALPDYKIPFFLKDLREIA